MFHILSEDNTFSTTLCVKHLFHLGLASELKNLNRKVFLFGFILMWSVMTSLGGFATEYWHLAITRLLLGILYVY